MPLVYAFRVIDMMFLHGSRVLFQVALAIIRVNGEALLKCEDDGECIAVFKEYFSSLDESEPSLLNRDRIRTRFDNLWEVAFREFIVIGDNAIEQLRNRYKNEVFQGIETFVKRTELRNLPKTPNLTSEQVSNVYDRYYSVLNNDPQAPNKGSVTMDFNSFEVFMSRLVNWVNASKKNSQQTKFLTRLYNAWSGEDGVMSLETLIAGLNKLIDHDIMNSLSNFIALYDEKHDGKIDRESVLQLAEDLIFITTPWRNGTVFDDITNKTIESEIARKIYERKLILKEQGIDTSDDEIRLPTEVRFNEDKWKVCPTG
ncbi:unnamed protein product [Ambrosiozyma monospora]|uniref:Unnamed protein product n=1 Tax=Ambrosiozyma monospora TaxID=43982 RepID=A0ACB5TSE8_AMBMO|nr:unnamed protein product [Ambrosiozyma monospora]